MRLDPTARLGYDGDVLGGSQDHFLTVPSGSTLRSVDVEEGDKRSLSLVAVGPSVGRKGRVACNRCAKVVVGNREHRCEPRTMEICKLCECSVVADGKHESRCVKPLESCPRAEFLGDALHTWDVKLLVLLSYSSDWTDEVKEYVSAGAQKRYLQSIGVELGAGASDHYWGSEFERLYGGEFRAEYLRGVMTEVGVNCNTVRMLTEGKYSEMVSRLFLRVAAEVAGDSDCAHLAEVERLHLD